MIKRAIWLGVGASMGAWGSRWANRRMRNIVDKYAPAEVRNRVQDRARTAGGRVRSAVDDGREAMREREAQLRGRNTTS